MRSLKDILELFKKGERRFIEDYFSWQIDYEVSAGYNQFVNTDGDTIEFELIDDSNVRVINATKTANAFYHIDFEDEDYSFGEMEFE